MRNCAIKTIEIVLLFVLITIFPANCMAAGRLFILGVDESGSYDLKDATSKIVEKIIWRTMGAGDVLIGRRITAESYPDTPENLLLPNSLVIPQSEPTSKNQFDVLSRNRQQKIAQQIKIYRLSAIKHIRNLEPINAQKTDIYGFLAAAADRLALMDGYEDNILLLASDMQDNCGRLADIDLKKARVVVMAFEKGIDPAKTLLFRKKWQERLMNMNASQIVFLGPDQSLDLVVEARGN